VLLRSIPSAAVQLLQVEREQLDVADGRVAVPGPDGRAVMTVGHDDPALLRSVDRPDPAADHRVADLVVQAHHSRGLLVEEQFLIREVRRERLMDPGVRYGACAATLTGTVATVGPHSTAS
jgi:hypothetical protein